MLGNQKCKCPFLRRGYTSGNNDFDIHIETTQILYKILAAVVYK